MNIVEFTDEELTALEVLIGAVLIGAYESNKRSKGICSFHAKQLEINKRLHEVIKGTSADRFLSIYEELKSGKHKGGF